MAVSGVTHGVVGATAVEQRRAHDVTAARTLGTVGGTGSSTFTITGGGANFQLASKVDINGQVSMGIQDVAARKLGNTAVGFLSSLASGKANNVVTGDISDAQKVVKFSRCASTAAAGPTILTKNARSPLPAMVPSSLLSAWAGCPCPAMPL